MRYLKTLDLWDNNTQTAIIQGQIKLQVGQWVKCGSEHLSRFVKVSQGRTLSKLNQCRKKKINTMRRKTQQKTGIFQYSQGTLEQRYENYLTFSDDGNGNDRNTGKPLKSFDEWLNS